MTTVAYRAGVMAADTCGIYTGDIKGHCSKLYRKGGAVLAFAGDLSPALVYLDWYGSAKPVPREVLINGEADFEGLILTKRGLFEVDKWCRPDKVRHRYHAIGSGASYAMAAMMAGASALRACEIACEFDPNSRGPIVSMKL